MIPVTLSRRIRIIQAINQLGLGGTEYALQLYSKYLDRHRFEVKVVSLYEGGERVNEIEKLGVKVSVLNGDLSRLPDLLDWADVFQWHGNGELDHKLFSIVEKSKPKVVIQTNVFGYYNHSPYYGIIDYDIYISKMILVRRMQRDKHLPENYLQKRMFLPYPVDVDYLTKMAPSSKDVDNFKQKRNLQNHFIVGRVGRADDNKFDLIALDGFAQFTKKHRDSRFLLVGATAKMISHATRLNIIDKMVIIDTTVDIRLLLTYYRSMDVFLAASQIGESFGMVIAEAMAVGTPVIAVSTENRDNAQIELMDNELSGIVVKRNKHNIAKALTHLKNNQHVARSMSIASNLKIERDYKAQNVVQSLEKLILNHLGLVIENMNNGTLLLPYTPSLLKEYKKRCVNLFGRLKIMRAIKLIFKTVK